MEKTMSIRFVLLIIFVDKNMWGILTCIKGKPVDEKVAGYVALLKSLEINNSKIVTWINNYVIQSIDIKLANYDTTKEIWDHLELSYTQFNFANLYKLESNISPPTEHSNYS